MGLRTLHFSSVAGGELFSEIASAGVAGNAVAVAGAFAGADAGTGAVGLAVLLCCFGSNYFLLFRFLFSSFVSQQHVLLFLLTSKNCRNGVARR